MEKLGDSATCEYPTCAEQHIRRPEHNYIDFLRRNLRVIIDSIGIAGSRTYPR